MNKMTMGIENYPIGQPKHDHFIIKETNGMEMNLMRRSGLSPKKWIKIYAEKFGNIFKDTESNRTLLELYGRDQGLAENYIEEKLKEQKLSDRN